MTTTTIDKPINHRVHAHSGKSKESRKTHRAGRLAPYGFVAPAVIFFIAFMVIPIGYAVYLSFQKYVIKGWGFSGKTETFAGLSNYADALSDPDLLAGLGHLAVYAVIAVPLTLGLALLFALLLDMPRVRAGKFSRIAIFIPYAVPGVVGALLWGFMYLPSTSPFSYLTQQAGMGAIPFLNSPWLFFSVANITIWSGVGFNMIIIYTSLRGIPGEIYEAARLDGATEWQIARRIKIPLVRPALILTAIFAVIGALQLYSEPTTLQPMTSSVTPTWVPLMLIYRDAFLTDDLPTAAALSVVLALGTVAISALVLWITNRRARRAQA